MKDAAQEEQEKESLSENVHSLANLAIEHFFLFCFHKILHQGSCRFSEEQFVDFAKNSPALGT